MSLRSHKMRNRQSARTESLVRHRRTVLSQCSVCLIAQKHTMALLWREFSATPSLVGSPILCQNTLLTPRLVTILHSIPLCRSMSIAPLSSELLFWMQKVPDNVTTNAVERHLFDSAKASRLKRLQRQACIDTYRSRLQTRYASILLVTNETFIRSQSENRRTLPPTVDNTYIATGFLADLTFGWNSYEWTDEDSIDINMKLSDSNHTLCSRGAQCSTLDPSSWIIHGYQIEYCLAERVEENCKIHFSVALASIVIVANLVKVILFGLSLWVIRDSPLLNLGDAITSFINRADVHTEGMCMMSRSDFTTRQHTLWERGIGARIYYVESHRWSKAASRRRWVPSLLL
jgi:hypothetical protein